MAWGLSNPVEWLEDSYNSKLAEILVRMEAF
jgi:hypothetical protein